MSGARRPPDALTELLATLRRAWVEESQSLAQLATVRPCGRPANRTIVVRALDEATLISTTDALSGKAADIAAGSWGELCWWFPERREQLRLWGPLRLWGEDAPAPWDARRAERWQALPEATRATFFGPPPGLPLAERCAEPVEGAMPERFQLLALEVEGGERLELAPRPHRRWRVERGEDGRSRGFAVGP